MTRDWAYWLVRHLPRGLRWDEVCIALLRGIGDTLEHLAADIDALYDSAKWPPSGAWLAGYQSALLDDVWAWASTVDLSAILRGGWDVREVEDIAYLWGVSGEFLDEGSGWVSVALDGYNILQAGEACGRPLVSGSQQHAALEAWLERCVMPGVVLDIVRRE